MSHPVTKDEFKTFTKDYTNLIKKVYLTTYKEVLHLSPYNIFEKIQDIYDENEGLVRKVEHKTGTGSVKTEKMSNREEYLKEEDFHKNGLSAIENQTSIYSITKRYNSPILNDNVIELSIQGGIKLLPQFDPNINWAELNNCIYQEDYTYLRKKLI